MRRVPEESGILKRSSAFLASLAHPSGKHLAGRNSRVVVDDDAKYLGPSTGYALSRTTSSRCVGLRGYFSILSSSSGDPDAQLRALHRSPSVQTLSTGGWKKKGVGVKKSVSFSSDTSFEEKRAPYRKPAVHEAKIYRKGVLQGECDRSVRARPLRGVRDDT